MPSGVVQYCFKQCLQNHTEEQMSNWIGCSIRTSLLTEQCHFGYGRQPCGCTAFSTSLACRSTELLFTPLCLENAVLLDYSSTSQARHLPCLPAVRTAPSINYRVSFSSPSFRRASFLASSVEPRPENCTVIP